MNGHVPFPYDLVTQLPASLFGVLGTSLCAVVFEEQDTINAAILGETFKPYLAKPMQSSWFVFMYANSLSMSRMH